MLICDLRVRIGKLIMAELAKFFPNHSNNELSRMSKYILGGFFEGVTDVMQNQLKKIGYEVDFSCLHTDYILKRSVEQHVEPTRYDSIILFSKIAKELYTFLSQLEKYPTVVYGIKEMNPVMVGLIEIFRDTVYDETKKEYEGGVITKRECDGILEYCKENRIFDLPVGMYQDADYF